MSIKCSSIIKSGETQSSAINSSYNTGFISNSTSGVLTNNQNSLPLRKEELDDSEYVLDGFIPIEDLDGMFTDYCSKHRGDSEEQFSSLEINDLLTPVDNTQEIQLTNVVDKNTYVIDKEQEELEIYQKEQEDKLLDIEYQFLTTSNLLARNSYFNKEGKKCSTTLWSTYEKLELAIQNFLANKQPELVKEKESQYFANIDTLEKYGINTTSKIKFSLYKSCFEDCVEKHTTQAGINQINAALLEFINHCDKQILIKKKNNQLVSMSDNIHTYGSSMYDFGSTKVYKEVLLMKTMKTKLGNYASIRFFILKSDNSSDNDKALEYLELETDKIYSYAELLCYHVRRQENRMQQRQYIVKRFLTLNLNRGFKRKRSDT